MDVVERLRRYLEQSGMTEYRLAKKSGLAGSTIQNIFQRNSVPSIATREAICEVFGITLSQFFAETEMVEITPELKEVFDSWAILTPAKKEAALVVLRALNMSDQ